MKFREGDIVRISNQSNVYNLYSSKQKLNAKVVKILDRSDFYEVGVIWENGGMNSFKEDELKLYRRINE